MQSVSLLLNCIDFVSDTILITDAKPIDYPGPRVLFVNRAFERMTGYAAGDIVGRNPRILQGPKTDRAELRRVREALIKCLPIRAEFINYKKDGEEFFVEMDVVPVFDDTGLCTYWVSIQRDVTARKRAEAEASARESQRYESLGTLSSGIAHDFNNIIASILGNVAIGSLDMESGQMPHASFAQINKAALRARSVVAKILAYSRRRSDATVPVELAPVVVEATDLLRAILPADARLEVVCLAKPVWIRGDATQLCQVLLNLGVNALQALEDRPGLIRFEMEVATDKADDPAAASAALIRVSDTGCGMDAATQSKIFEPYFTTKQGGRGTGLGMSVVWGIVAAHEGSISIDSEVGQGTRFTVSLPQIDELVPESAPEFRHAAAPGPVGDGERVLVVDDDDVVLVMLEAMLRRWGFRVIAMREPLQAIELLKGAPSDFDVLVTDLNMPAISGLQLAREALAIRPDLPVILGSGTVSEGIKAAASKAGISAVFAKEYAVEQLGALIRRVLPVPAPRAETQQPSDVLSHRHGEIQMHSFLRNNYDLLVARCKAKVAERPQREATDAQLVNGVPLVLDQLIRTLVAEEAGELQQGFLISGFPGGSPGPMSEIGFGARAHGKQLLELGYTVEQVVHDYGDLCQSITDLAVERDAPFSVNSYRTLNRCLDNAIASAVTEFATQRDALVDVAHASGESQRLGFLAHELRNYLNVALMAFDALETGPMSIAGSTGATLKQNLLRLDKLIGQTLSEYRHPEEAVTPMKTFSLATFIADASAIGCLYADSADCTMHTPAVDEGLYVRGNRDLLLAALTNLLQNAFKFTKSGTEVTLRAYAMDVRVLIDVSDHCGGLEAGTSDRLFVPLSPPPTDGPGLGLGLSIAAKSVKASGGTLTVRNYSGHGCVFTIALPSSPPPALSQ